MKQILQYVTLISAVLLTVVILLQNQGAGLGGAWGGEGNFYRSKRGAEKALFYATIVIAIIFVGSLLGGLVVK
jgi:protein translocase SecG subunit